MKLPGSEQGSIQQGSHPIGIPVVSSRSSLKLKPPYLLLAYSLYPESLWSCSSTDQWYVGKKGQASEWCWLRQLLTPCPLKQWSSFRIWPSSSPCWLHRKNTVGFSGSTCTTADTRWAAGWDRCVVKAVLPYVLQGWVKDIGILCYSYLEDRLLSSNAIKMEGRRG